MTQQRSAQRAWVNFRDEDCDVVEYVWYRGSGAGVATAAWKRRLTEDRTQQLRDMYDLHHD